MNNELKDLCHKLSDLKEAKRVTEKNLKALNAEIDSISDILVSQWANEGISSMVFDELGTFYVNRTIRARCINEKILYEYLRENGAGAMIRETIPHQTLSAWAKECKESGMSEEAMKNLGLELYEQTDVRLRK